MPVKAQNSEVLFNECSVIDLIRARNSVRSFRPEAMAEDTRRKFQVYLDSQYKGPFGNAVRFALVDRAEFTGRKFKLGTYGFIKNSRTFIVAAVRDGAGAHEDFGYLFERVILFAQSLGLGTCWLGGTFRRSEFGRTIGLQPDELLPAISPVGYAMERRSLRDRLIRIGAGSDRRKPWNELFFDYDTREVLSPEKAGSYTQALEMLRLAPSASNRQPWRIFRQKDNFHFFLQRSTAYPEGKNDLQKVDLGIAMCHFELTAGEVTAAGKWKRMEVGLPGGDNLEYIVSWSAS